MVKISHRYVNILHSVVPAMLFWHFTPWIPLGNRFISDFFKRGTIICYSISVCLFQCDL